MKLTKKTNSQLYKLHNFVNISPNEELSLSETKVSKKKTSKNKNFQK